LDHIATVTLPRSEAIISENLEHHATFFLRSRCRLRLCELHAFTDEYSFWLGAEIESALKASMPVSSQGLAELCSYKWVVAAGTWAGRI